MNHRAIALQLAASTSRFALAFAALLPLSAGCVAAADEDLGGADEQIGEAEDVLASAPATCAEVRAANPAAGNGDYTLFLDHDPAKPWRAYCHDMASAPAEFLTLENVGSSVNFSQYTPRASQGTTVRTQYTRVRIDPATLRVDVSDQTFTTSSGQLTHGSATVTSMPFGVAMSCNSQPSGLANIDLTGTPFFVAAGEFQTGGNAASGTTTYGSGGQVVNLTGGGYCGWNAAPGAHNPFNDAGGFQLDLEYRGPATCAEILDVNPSAGDGLYTLYVGHDLAKPWTAHCFNMPWAPAEYLKLHNVGSSANFSQYTAGGPSPGTSVRTSYTKIRVDPVTLLVDISDQVFSTSVGQLTHGSDQVTSMPFGVAMSCDAGPSGVANIDLTGTPFAVAPNEFLQGGTAGSGSATYSSGGRVVNLTGGGFCGWTCASPATFNPYNEAGDFQLALAYAP